MLTTGKILWIIVEQPRMSFGIQSECYVLAMFKYGLSYMLEEMYIMYCPMVLSEYKKHQDEALCTSTSFKRNPKMCVRLFSSRSYKRNLC